MRGWARLCRRDLRPGIPLRQAGRYLGPAVCRHSLRPGVQLPQRGPEAGVLQGRHLCGLPVFRQLRRGAGLPLRLRPELYGLLHPLCRSIRSRRAARGGAGGCNQYRRSLYRQRGRPAVRLCPQWGAGQGVPVPGRLRQDGAPLPRRVGGAGARLRPGAAGQLPGGGRVLCPGARDLHSAAGELLPEHRPRGDPGPGPGDRRLPPHPYLPPAGAAGGAARPRPRLRPPARGSAPAHRPAGELRDGGLFLRQPAPLSR